MDKNKTEQDIRQSERKAVAMEALTEAINKAITGPKFNGLIVSTYPYYNWASSKLVVQSTLYGLDRVMDKEDKSLFSSSLRYKERLFSEEFIDLQAVGAYARYEGKCIEDMITDKDMVKLANSIIENYSNLRSVKGVLQKGAIELEGDTEHVRCLSLRDTAKLRAEDLTIDELLRKRLIVNMKEELQGVEEFFTVLRLKLKLAGGTVEDLLKGLTDVQRGIAESIVTFATGKVINHFYELEIEDDDGDAAYAAKRRYVEIPGSQGCGKTYATVSALAYLKIKAPEIKTCMMSIDANGGFVLHKEFNARPDVADVVVFNDVHYFLNAIINGKISREHLGYFRNLVKNLPNSKCVIFITERELDAYVEGLGEHPLNRIGKYNATASVRLDPMGFTDMKSLQQINSVLKIDSTLLRVIADFKPNPRFMATVANFYGEDSRDTWKLCNRLNSSISREDRKVDYERLIDLINLLPQGSRERQFYEKEDAVNYDLLGRLLIDNILREMVKQGQYWQEMRLRW